MCSFSETVENNSMMATSQGLVTIEHSIIKLGDALPRTEQWPATRQGAARWPLWDGESKTLPIMIMYNMKFVAVDTYDIGNVGLRSQMVRCLKKTYR